ncbi:MAG: hypothetical protein KA746_02195 [Pyrinomonadaceae bacterium]|nr:hypothetical protein [Pyrinomonadaceae bacterium]MBP6211530.1 hypothetical protein [Pyrinomonadaceae bacterium]
MDATKLHLLFNYLPLIGTAIGPIVLIYGARKFNVKAQMTGFGILVLTAIATLVVFGTGEAAGKGTDLLVGQVWTNIQEHRRSALPAFAAVEATGIFALFGAINSMRKKAVTMWLVVIILVLSLASIGFTARTAYLGRSIHQVEAQIAK